MTIVVDGHDGIVDQVQKQLLKLIDVVTVSDLTNAETVTRELALVKVQCTADRRREVLDLLEIFRAQAIDVSPTSLVVQVVADEERLSALVRICARTACWRWCAPAASQ